MFFWKFPLLCGFSVVFSVDLQFNLPGATVLLRAAFLGAPAPGRAQPSPWAPRTAPQPWVLGTAQGTAPGGGSAWRSTGELGKGASVQGTHKSPLQGCSHHWDRLSFCFLGLITPSTRFLGSAPCQVLLGWRLRGAFCQGFHGTGAQGGVRYRIPALCGAQRGVRHRIPALCGAHRGVRCRIAALPARGAVATPNLGVLSWCPIVLLVFFPKDV